MPDAPPSQQTITVYYLDRFGRRRELPVKQAAQVPFEQLAPLQMPVPYPGRQSFVTKAWASATGQSLACGSLRQQRCAMLLDRDPEVAARSAGPMELHWTRGGGVQSLRPDFVALRAGRREVICVQPKESTDGWRAGQELLAQAAVVADWRVRVMRPPDGVELDNLMLLYAARSPQHLALGDAEALARHFTSARTIRSGVRAAGLPTFTGVDLAYHLIWKRRLHTDMTRPLTPSSTAWLGEDE
ncbi:TnsA-like heteromeric transposase endonuclease subunit [Streptomyces parvus]